MHSDSFWRTRFLSVGLMLSALPVDTSCRCASLSSTPKSNLHMSCTASHRRP